MCYTSNKIRNDDMIEKKNFTEENQTKYVEACYDEFLHHCRWEHSPRYRAHRKRRSATRYNGALKALIYNDALKALNDKISDMPEDVRTAVHLYYVMIYGDIFK